MIYKASRESIVQMRKRTLVGGIYCFVIINFSYFILAPCKLGFHRISWSDISFVLIMTFILIAEFYFLNRFFERKKLRTTFKIGRTAIFRMEGDHEEKIPFREIKRILTGTYKEEKACCITINGSNKTFSISGVDSFDHLLKSVLRIAKIRKLPISEKKLILHLDKTLNIVMYLASIFLVIALAQIYLPDRWFSGSMVILCIVAAIMQFWLRPFSRMFRTPFYLVDIFFGLLLLAIGFLMTLFFLHPVLK